MKLKFKVHSICVRFVLIYIVTDFLKNAKVLTIKQSDFIMKKQKIYLPISNSNLNTEYNQVKNKRIVIKLFENKFNEEQTTYLQNLMKEKLIDPLKKYHLSGLKYR